MGADHDLSAFVHSAASSQQTLPLLALHQQQQESLSRSNSMTPSQSGSTSPVHHTRQHHNNSQQSHITFQSPETCTSSHAQRQRQRAATFACGHEAPFIDSARHLHSLSCRSIPSSLLSNVSVVDALQSESDSSCRVKHYRKQAVRFEPEHQNNQSVKSICWSVCASLLAAGSPSLSIYVCVHVCVVF